LLEDMIDVGAEMRRAIGEIFSQRRFRVQPVEPNSGLFYAHEPSNHSPSDGACPGWYLHVPAVTIGYIGFLLYASEEKWFVVEPSSVRLCGLGYGSSLFYG
jgi:hypothetical protein